MQLTERQKEIVNIVKNQGPITGEAIAQQLNLTRAALRADLTILVMSGLLDAKPRVGYYYAGKTPQSEIAETIKKMKVQDIKSVPIVIGEDVSVYDTIVTLFIEDVGTIFVVGEKGILKGVVSRKDLIKVTMGKSDIYKMPVKMIMTRMPNIVTTSLEESVVDAARKITEHQVDSLPVIRSVNDEGPNKGQPEVVGRITKTNITKLFLELGEGN
ncbi:MAG: helix-turn-helix transcriptional regulator [Desulfitobacteriaceae bacterium]|nr:helix-turn-helix transcriptional regulator [Desulfitobacteriaceae bacterium]MDD4752928.1 helix-turn-helix transcriptional regulator [Desulfitobacteriaceae bacterium]